LYMRTWQTYYQRLDRGLIAFMNVWGIRLLRYALAVTFIWFGALKIFHVSPVADLVASTVYWLPAEFVVPAIGWWEVIVGVGLLFRLVLRLILFFFFLQMAGTFLVLVMHPALAFQDGNPLLLTVLGEFVIKNLVLLSAGLVIGSTVRRGEPPRQAG
jgi:uncharacterized membrane protein YkgB